MIRNMYLPLSVLSIVLAILLSGCQVTLPPESGETLRSVVEEAIGDSVESIDASSQVAKTEDIVAEEVPVADSAELTLDALVGLWEKGCVTFEVNADGTYRTWNGPPIPGGFPKEAGRLELDDTLIISHPTDEGLLCRGETSIYEVIAWSEDEFELALVEDDCPMRAGGPVGHYYRIAPIADEECCRTCCRDKGARD